MRLASERAARGCPGPLPALPPRIHVYHVGSRHPRATLRRPQACSMTQTVGSVDETLRPTSAHVGERVCEPRRCDEAGEQPGWPGLEPPCRCIPTPSAPSPGGSSGPSSSRIPASAASENDNSLGTGRHLGAPNVSGSLTVAQAESAARRPTPVLSPPSAPGAGKQPG